MIKKVKYASIIAFIVFCLLFIKKAVGSNISSIEDFQVFMKGYGNWGPVVLTIIQAFQVVIPVMPGYVGCAVGAISYGPVIGFICNYTGICLGSIIAYLLAERYGKKIVTEMFSEKQYNKWIGRIKKHKSYDKFLFTATLLPMFPDDFLCYLSGLMNIGHRKFFKIIVLGKPWCILAYCIVFGMIK